MEKDISTLKAERAILGAIIQDAKLIHRIRDIVRPEDLSKEINRKVLGILYEMTDKGIPIDLVTVGKECAHLGELKEIGGAENYFSSIMEACATAENIETYARIVKDDAIQRQIKEACQKTINETGKHNAETLLGNLQRELAEVAKVKRLLYRSIGQIAGEFFDHLQHVQTGKRVLKGVRPGMVELERKVRRFGPGNLIVVGGRPGMGKSAICIVFTLKFTAQGKRVGIFSPEMTEGELFARFLAIRSRVELSKLNDPDPGIFTQEEWNRIVRAMDDLSKAGIVIDETSAINLEALKAKAHRMVKEDRIEVIFVDHLGQMRAQTRYKGTRREEITAIAQGLKALAKDLKIPIFALSQLNREPEDRVEKIGGKSYRGVPRVSDLRESGDLEQEADVILLPYRPFQYNTDLEPGEFWLIVGKHRQGETGKCFLRWRGDLAEIFEKDDEAYER